MGTRLTSKKKRSMSSTSSKRQAGRADDNAESPLYQQISRILREEIVSGEYPVGSLLPTEDNLCERFSVSRYTIREALRRLRDDGLVSSRQGAGTVVVPPRSSGADIQQMLSINDLVVMAKDTPFEIESIKTVVIDKKLSARSGLPVGEEWLEVCGYRQSENTEYPLSWSEYYINREYAAVARLLQRHVGPIFPLIEDMFGLNIVEVHQQISATLVSPKLSVVLKTDAGSAALEVRRTYKASDNKIVQVTINTHPASRFQHSMTMKRVKA